MMKVLYHLVLLIIFDNLYCYCGIEVTNFISSFKQYEDSTNPWNWTLRTPALDIHVSIKDAEESTITVGILFQDNTSDCTAFDYVTDKWEAFGNLKNFSSGGSGILNIFASLPMLNASYDMSVFFVKYTMGISEIKTLEESTIIIQGCNKTVKGTIEEIEVTTSSEDASYNKTGNCTCKESNAELYKDEKKFDGKAWCNAVTEWSGCQEAECWFAPKVNSISQGSNYSGESANFACSYDHGFPNITVLVFFISNKNEPVPQNKTLNSSDHNKTYWCEANNDYTGDTNKSAVSSVEYLVVFFSPEIAKPTEREKFIELYNSTVVSFDFQANPASDNITATFSMPNGTTTNETIEKNSRDVNYKISYYITINSSKDYGFYNFTVGTIYPEDCDFASINIVDQPVTTTASLLTTTTNLDTTSPKPDTLYIAIGCSGAVVLIIVLVVFLIIYRKRKGKSASDEDIKEERENPLYGSAPGPSPNAEYATVDKSKKKQEKEEKVNPIYQGTSAGADADTVEEAYAAIDIKKKKKKKEKNSEGSENSAFDPEATYAAVNKPKKKKNVEPPPDVVYSAVQKKKKNDQPSDTDLHV